LYSSLNIFKAVQCRRVTLAGYAGCAEEIRRATEFYLENLKERDHFGNILEYSRMNYIYKSSEIRLESSAFYWTFMCSSVMHEKLKY
jgi:hypothetical protein